MINNQDIGSLRVHGTINGPNQEPRIELNLQSNPEPLNTQQSLNRLGCSYLYNLIIVIFIFFLLFCLVFGILGSMIYFAVEWGCYPSCPHGRYR